MNRDSASSNMTLLGLRQRMILAQLTEEDLTPAEKQYQRTVVRVFIVVSLTVTPLIGLGYLAAYILFAPVWPTLVLALALLWFTPMSLYSRALYQHGETTRAVRAMLTWMLITSGLVTALLIESLMLIGVMVAIMVALLALFLEPRRVAVRWVLASGVVYIAAMLVRHVVTVPAIELGVIEIIFLFTAPVAIYATIAVVGRSTIEFLRGTLRESEAVRAQAVESYKQSLQASRVAMEANRLKSEFLSTMSHELRTPLNAIIGFTGVMLGGMGGQLDEDAVHMMKRINSNSLHLLDLINNILDLSKVESDHFAAVSKPFSPRDLIRKQHDQMLSLAGDRDIAFEIEVDPALPAAVMGDEDIVQRIVINLLSNAFKFTESGSVRLKASVCDYGEKWAISVIDTGIGIPPEAHEYIFDPFRQIDGSSSRHYGGSGLGLAIVKELVREIKGKISLVSTPGEGSTFTVEMLLIPVGEAAEQVVA